jgi:hypothetical protein
MGVEVIGPTYYCAELEPSTLLEHVPTMVIDVIVGVL